MNFLKKYMMTFILVGILLLVIFNLQWLSDKFTYLLQKNPYTANRVINQYAKDYDFEFVKLSNNYKPYSRGDLINVIYTIINNGWNNFTFYCPSEYLDCVADVEEISSNEVLLTHINNFAHPYNSFDTLHISYYENGEVVVEIEKLYDQNKIDLINEKLDKIMKEIIFDDMDLEDKIKAIHDYIIDNTKYDVIRNDSLTSPYESHSAYGVLFQGYGICSGYADVSAIFLEKLGIKNMRILSSTHVWNGAFINDEWLHLDLTWDDPVSKDGQDTLWHKFMLINNEELEYLDTDTEDHIFDKSIYLEFK